MTICMEIIALGPLILYMYQHTKGRTIEKVAGESNEVLGGCIDNIVNEIASITHNPTHDVEFGQNASCCMILMMSAV
jgi:hypothetical protein